MGYSERLCMICGSGFNIARMRRTDEPLDMAWDSDGTTVGCQVEGEGMDADSNCVKAGCSEGEGDHACGGPSCSLTQGENCTYQGYNGWNIDVEEMKVMTFVQAVYLNDKPEQWTPAPDDDEFENEDLILTTISESAPDEWDVTHVPYRHGVGGDLWISDGEAHKGCGVPFHGPCYQVLKRRLGSLESRPDNPLDGMISLCDRDEFPGSVSEDVQACNEQAWSHVPGTEYLAADPYRISGLERLLRECTMDFVTPEVFASALRTTKLSKDPFTKLPPELRLLVFGLLGYKDVANLRLVSRTFGVLPQRFFHDMIRERMPWIWEADEQLSTDHMDWYKLWSELSQADGGKGRGENGLSFALEKPELGRGDRINGLVNRRRVWYEVEHVLQGMLETS